MLATYGVDVLDPAVTLRRIHVLASRLPAGALTRLDSPAQWSNEAHLLARLNDAIDLLTWVTMRVAGSKASRPKPLVRPGGTTRSPGRADVGGQRVKWGDLGGMLSKTGMVNANGR